MSAVVDRPRLTVPISGRDHVRGSVSAQATLLEYGDYECPFCAAAHGEVNEWLRDATRFLLSDESSYVTGSPITVDGGGWLPRGMFAT